LGFDKHNDDEKQHHHQRYEVPASKTERSIRGHQIYKPSQHANSTYYKSTFDIGFHFLTSLEVAIGEIVSEQFFM
jgi:hypothetical protein